MPYYAQDLCNSNLHFFQPGSNLELQQIRRMVRGSQRGRRRRMGPLQLRHTGQLVGEALVVPRSNLQERGRVPSQLRHQRIVPRPRVRVLAGPAVHLVAIRWQSVPLPDSAGRRLVLLCHR